MQLNKKTQEYKIFHIDFQEKKLESIESWTEEVPDLPIEGVLFLAAFDKGDTILTKFITNDSKNKIPQSLSMQKYAAVKWNKSFAISDFGLDHSGVFGSLSFGGKAHMVFLTWDSIFHMSTADNEELGSWPDKIK